jgi:hypothetical protein
VLQFSTKSPSPKPLGETSIPHQSQKLTETFFDYICNVKRLIAISFLFIFLTANTAFGQILRLPTLVHHYLEHVEWDNMTLSEFLSQHYAATINHPDDKHHDHQKLPFKVPVCDMSQVVTLVPQPTFPICQINPDSVELKKPFYKQQDYSNAYLNNIWQPPRFS